MSNDKGNKEIDFKVYESVTGFARGVCVGCGHSIKNHKMVDGEWDCSGGDGDCECEIPQ